MDGTEEVDDLVFPVFTRQQYSYSIGHYQLCTRGARPLLSNTSRQYAAASLQYYHGFEMCPKDSPVVQIKQLWLTVHRLLV